jgi:SNF2 family DNA or RNA helicase
MPSLVPEQIEGARFLANNARALLADEPGFGKSAQAVAACDFVCARRILVLTTASARVNWLNEFEKFSPKLPVLLIDGNRQQRSSDKSFHDSALSMAVKTAC